MSTSKQFMLGNPIKVAESKVQPTVGLSVNYVVTMYRESLAVGSKLYYRAGTINNSFGKITLGNETPVSNNNSGDADKGETPSIAVNDSGLVIEIHEANGHSNALWTHVGVIDSNDKTLIHWGDHQQTGHEGYNPSIGLANYSFKNIAVAVYTSGTQDTVIYVMIGEINSAGKTVTKWTKLTHAFHGRNPKIAVNNLGKVVITFNDDYGGIFSVVGTINSACTDITWYGETPVVSGTKDHASVGLANDGSVVLVYQGQAIKDDIASIQYEYDFPIKCKFGTLDSNDLLTWESDELHGFWMGKKPDIATNGTCVVSVQETPDFIEGGVQMNNSNVNMASSLIKTIYTDRSSWMGHYNTKSLKQLSLPAAHDAGMSTVDYCTNLAELHSITGTVTQSKGFKEMLDCGIRYFDVRPVWLRTTDNGVDTDVAYTGHYADKMGGIGCMGIDMKSVFDDVAAFIEEVHTEVIILKFSHYFLQTVKNNLVDHTTVDQGADDSDSAVIFDPLKQSLIESLLTKFPDNLYVKRASDTRRIVDILLSELVGSSTKIIAVFDEVNMDRLYPVVGMTGSTLQHNQYVRTAIHTYGDYYLEGKSASSKNNFELVVYDRYTNTDEMETMASASTPSDDDHPGQLYQYNQSAFHSGSDLYLMSWTLTQQTFKEVITGSPSIQTLASEANSALGGYMQCLIQNAKISSSTMPNLIYVDFCDDFVTDVCNFINAIRYPTNN